MPVQTLISEAEYLEMAFEGPDREFADGEVVERNVGDSEHGLVQLLLGVHFHGLGKSQPIHGRPEQRLRLRPGRYRVADFAVFVGSIPTGAPAEPPAIVVEIVSRNDRYLDIVRGLEEYRAWGVRHVWLVDPWERKLMVYENGGLPVVKSYEVPELGVSLSHEELFPQGPASGV